MTTIARPARLLAALAVVAAASGAALQPAASADDPEPAACSLPGQLADQSRCWWATFLDPYSGATVDYPADLLRPEPDYGARTMRRFVSRDGAVALTIWASRADNGITIREAMATDIYRSGFEEVSDQHADDTGYLIGGHHGSRAFLKKVRWAAADVPMTETACITWPISRGTAWKTLAEKILGTLRDGRGWARNPRLDPSEIQHTEGYCGGL